MLTEVLFRIVINIAMLLIVGLIYFFIRKKMVYFITSFLIALTTFSLVFILSKNQFGIATGIGLFAIFGIIRYRTEQVPIVEMTYFFVCITISLVNAIADDHTVKMNTAFVINSGLIIATGLLLYFNQKTECAKMELLIDSIEWIHYTEEKKLEFLTQKSFNKIVQYKINSIDHLKETCSVTVYFKDKY